MRGIPTILTLGLLTQGCVIYEERYTGDTACPPKAPGAPRPGGDDGVEDPDPEPIVMDLFLTDDDGEVGEVLLSTLLSSNGTFDLRRVTSVSFAHSVTVNDAIVREDEVVLLLAVDTDATPGLVDAFVTLDDGAVGLIASPFHVLAATGGGGDDTGRGGGGNGSTGGDGSTDTGSSGGTDTTSSGRQCPPMTDTSDTGC